VTMTTLGVLNRLFLTCRSQNALRGTNCITYSRRFISTSKIFSSVRLYSDKHEWVTVDGKVGTVGISDYAQASLGDIVFAQLPDVGAEFGQHDECGALESVKAASEVYTPVSGKVTVKNTELENSPGLINKACYSQGWLFKIELKNPDELKTLMSEEKYEKYLKSQAAASTET